MTRTITGSIVSSAKRVTTAGDPEALVATSTPVLWVTIQAETDNTGRCALGDSAVVATEGATATGIVLEAGDSTAFGELDLADLYLDVTVSTDGVSFTYGKVE